MRISEDIGALRVYEQRKWILPRRNVKIYSSNTTILVTYIHRLKPVLSNIVVFCVLLFDPIHLCVWSAAPLSVDLSRSTHCKRNDYNSFDTILRTLSIHKFQLDSRVFIRIELFLIYFQTYILILGWLGVEGAWNNRVRASAWNTKQSIQCAARAWFTRRIGRRKRVYVHVNKTFY